jgi:hypothetical protein
MAASSSTVFAVLRAKVGFEVVSKNESASQLWMLGRIPDDTQGLNGNNWKIVMWRLLQAMKNRPWKADLSKDYFIKEETGKLVFAWRVILQGTDIAKHYADIANIIQTSPSARAEVMEIPLAGVSADRNNTAGGRRGAGPAGTVAVGPMAVQQKMRGG